MGSLEPTNLMFLLFAVAIIAAVCGSLGSAVAKRKERRTRSFAAGVFCGMTLATVLRHRRRALKTLDALARSAGVRLPGADEPTRRRQLRRVGR
ncbi:MAG: hypothetical protein ABWY93_01865 [Mycobacterium sp.]